MFLALVFSIITDKHKINAPNLFHLCCDKLRLLLFGDLRIYFIGVWVYINDFFLNIFYLKIYLNNIVLLLKKIF